MLARTAAIMSRRIPGSASSTVQADSGLAPAQANFNAPPAKAPANAKPQATKARFGRSSAPNSRKHRG